MVKSSTINIGGKISKKVKSENPFIKYTLDNLSAGFNIVNQNKSDVILESVDISRLNTNLDYNLRFPSDNYVEAFKWTEKIPLVGNKISDTKFFYTPTTFVTGIKINRNLSEKVSRSNRDLIEDFTLGLERKFTINYKVFDNTQLTYNKNIRSDMSDYRDKVLENFKVGNLTNSTESFSYIFNPQWIDWFKPNFSYNSNYSWSRPLNSVIDAANLNLNSNATVNFSISPTEIMETFYTPPSSKKSSEKTSQRTRSRGLASLDIDDEKDSEKKVSESKKKKVRDNFILERIYEQTKKIEPMNITISNVANITDNGINGDVPITYKFGFDKDLNIDSVPEVGFNTGSDDIKKTFTARTGIRFNPVSYTHLTLPTKRIV